MLNMEHQRVDTRTAADLCCAALNLRLVLPQQDPFAVLTIV